MMEKTFTVAGTSNLNGAVKFRFANDLAGRIKVLEYHGHTDVRLFELPRAMTKVEAIAWLESMSDQPEPEVVEPEVQGAALSVTEDAIQQMVDEVVRQGRPRNEKGHFIKMEVLRQRAIEQLAVA